MASAILEEITTAIGLPAAVELARVYGGRTLRVPQQVSAAHPISVAIGLSAAHRLCNEFAGMALDVPSERTALRALRDSIIVREYRAGQSIRALATEWYLSRKMIHKILEAAGCPRRFDV